MRATIAGAGTPTTAGRRVAGVNMDLVVGVLCEDGVVVGSADSGPAESAGFDAACHGGFHGGSGLSATTRVLHRDAILAGAGRTGLAQRLADVVGSIRADSRFQEWTGLGIARMISAEMIDDLASTRCDPGRLGALLAFRACDGFQLCEFAASDLQPELKTPERWIALTGTGRAIADRFVALLQRVFFADTRPGLDESVFAAAWILDYTVGMGFGTVGPGSVSGRRAIEIAVLTEEEAGLPPAARLLAESELADCLARVRAAEKHLATFRQKWK
jgi:hypothetical protein